MATNLQAIILAGLAVLMFLIFRNLKRRLKEVSASVNRVRTIVRRIEDRLQSTATGKPHSQSPDAAAAPGAAREPTEVGMTTQNEQWFYSRCTRELYRGEGEIVDLGCWMGSTTIQMARGLSENSLLTAQGKKIHAYDRFRWEQYMEDIVTEFNMPVGRDLEPGESFLPDFEKRLGDYAEYVDVHVSDLGEETWPGEPIEILLVDAMKSWGLTNNILSQFFPSLIPGKSILIHQDFKYHLTYWIHLTQYRLREYFELFENVPQAFTMAFRNTKEIPSELLNQNYSLESFSREEIDEAMDYWHLIARSDGEGYGRNLIAAKAKLLLDLGDLEGARRTIDTRREFAYELDKDLATVDAMIVKAS